MNGAEEPTVAYILDSETVSALEASDPAAAVQVHRRLADRAQHVREAPLTRGPTGMVGPGPPVDHGDRRPGVR